MPGAKNDFGRGIEKICFAICVNMPEKAKERKLSKAKRILITNKIKKMIIKKKPSPSKVIKRKKKSKKSLLFRLSNNIISPFGTNTIKNNPEIKNRV